VATAEKAKYGIALSSGTATSMALVTALPKGAHIVCLHDCYAGTRSTFEDIAPNLGHETTFVDLSDPQNLAACLLPSTRMVWIETPTNPTLRLVDIAAVAQIIQNFNQQELQHPANTQEITMENQVILVVDNTFMTPYFQQPLTLGAHVVVHSVTKYINGHSDCLMGMICTNSAGIYKKLKSLQSAMGAVPSPFDCYLAHRGFKTLHVRMEKHAENALALARALETSPYVAHVKYPGLPSHSQHKLALKQASGTGGMIAMTLRGTLHTAVRFLKALKVFTLAESLGGVESLAELPAIMTHQSLAQCDKEALGISDTMIRLSVGIEHVDDLIEDVFQALELAQA
jgi:cystathionine gamma-lyase